LLFSIQQQLVRITEASLYLSDSQKEYREENAEQLVIIQYEIPILENIVNEMHKVCVSVKEGVVPRRGFEKLIIVI